MNFSAPSALAAKAHLAPAGKPAPPRPRTSAPSTSARRPCGPSSVSARRSPLQSPARMSTGSGRRLDPLRLLRGPALPGDRPLDHARPGVDRVADPDRRGGVAEAEADGLGQGDGAVGAALAGSDPEPLAHPLDRGRPPRRRSRRSRCRRARAARPAGRAGRRRRSRPRRQRPPAAPRPRRPASDRRRSPRRDRPSPPSAPRARWAHRRSDDDGSARRDSGTRLLIYRLHAFPDQIEPAHRRSATDFFGFRLRSFERQLCRFLGLKERFLRFLLGFLQRALAQ